MRISVQNMSQHYPGDSQGVWAKRDNKHAKQCPCWCPETCTSYTSCLHSHFCCQNHRLCEERMQGCSEGQRGPSEPSRSLEALQLHTKRSLSLYKSQCFHQLFVNLTILSSQKSSFSVTSARFHFPTGQLSDRRYRGYISYFLYRLWTVNQKIYLSTSVQKPHWALTKSFLGPW